MGDWEAIEAVGALLSDFPARLAGLHGEGIERRGDKEEVVHGLEIIRQALMALGPVAMDEPKYSEFPGLATVRHEFVEKTNTLREVSGERLRTYLEARQADLEREYRSRGLTLPGIARAIIRPLIGWSAGDLLAEAPTYYAPDPGNVREHALEWLEENALLLREDDLNGCLRVMISRVGDKLVPLAKRLYHHPDMGPKLRQGIEEIFVDELVDEIKAAG